MSLPNDGERRTVARVRHRSGPSGMGSARLARDFFDGRYRPGQSVQLGEMAAEYAMDNKSIVKAFAEFQSLGMVTLLENCSAIVLSPNPKEMQEAYEIRAAL